MKVVAPLHIYTTPHLLLLAAMIKLQYHCPIKVVALSIPATYQNYARILLMMNLGTTKGKSSGPITEPTGGDIWIGFYPLG